jgi:hypothetical protein
VVRWEDERLLLATSPAGVTLLARAESPAPEPVAPDPAGEGA